MRSRTPTLAQVRAPLTVPLLAVILAWAVPATASPRPALAATTATLTAQLEAAVRDRAGLPADARVTITDVRASDRSDPSDARVHSVTLPEGERGTGLVAARVELDDGRGATTWIRARVDVEAPALVAARPLARGTVLRTEDLERAMVTLRPDHLAAKHEAIGRVLERSMRAGDPVRARWLREPVLIERGSLVRAVVRRGQVVAEADAEALDDASAGEVIRVRMVSSGRAVRVRVIDGRRVEVLR